MIIVLKSKTTKEEIIKLTDNIKKLGLEPVEFEGEERVVIHVLGDIKSDAETHLKSIGCVEKTVRVDKPYKLASKGHDSQTTIVKVGGVSIGNGNFVVIAGPCSAESESQLMKSAEIIKKSGLKIMRASVFKPRTSPYDFQGLGIEGLKLLKKIRDKTGILMETEVMDVRDVAIASEYVDVLRIGARNMQNYDLLKEVGKSKKPVILKRGISAKITEFLMAAEYILYHGNKNVILCERGIRTFEDSYRNTLDLGGVAVLKSLTHLPVIVDPSHAAGKRELVPAFSKASVAVGADGLIVEVHPDPENALSDGAQSLYPEQLADLLKDLKPVCKAVGKKL